MILKDLVIVLSACMIYLSNQLTCTIYDYTKETVACTTSCPSNSVLVNTNKCLRNDQYLISGNVQMCLSKHTSADRLLCCEQDQFIFDNQCNVCNGNTYQNGQFCCSNSQYMNYAAKAIGCTKISFGQCPSLTIQTKFKICCPSGQFYHLQLQICASTSLYNCDNTYQVCCNKGNYLEFLSQQKRYQCVPNCNWNALDNIRCSKPHCNQNLMVLPSYKSLKDFYNTVQFNRSTNLLTVQGQCCYGMSPISQCYKNYTVDCGQRFISRGWTICCPFGTYYSVKDKSCLSSCAGYAILNILCITNATYLNLGGSPGSAPVQQSTPSCNGINLPKQFPICCPTNFYFDGIQGCKYCSGTIHKVSLNQLCCLQGWYYDRNQEICKYCNNGKVDLSGTLCCFYNQYFTYSSNGIGSCNSICDLSNVYQTSYCCQSSSNTQCQLTGFKPTSCSSEYFIQNSCQLCSKFCSNTVTCSNSNVAVCNKLCGTNTVYFADLADCLGCDSSCDGCSAPFDSSACSACAQGYTMVNKACVRCNIDCKTCSGSADNCTSCYQNSPKPYNQNGLCLKYCGSGSFDSNSSSNCNTCNFNCVECDGSATNQCSKCSQGKFISSSFLGQCAACTGTCNQCFRNSSSCLSCKSPYKYYQNTKSCTGACQSNQISYLIASLQICIPCHSSCKSCQLSPQNCFQCKNNTQYLDTSLGVSICSNCVKPCVLCISLNKLSFNLSEQIIYAW